MRPFDPATGERRWKFKRTEAIFTSGTLSTASGLLFTGVAGFGPTGNVVNGDFYALDANTGQLLWRRVLPGGVNGGPISYSVSGRQYVAVNAANTLFALGGRPRVSSNLPTSVIPRSPMNAEPDDEDLVIRLTGGRKARFWRGRFCRAPSQPCDQA